MQQNDDVEVVPQNNEEETVDFLQEMEDLLEEHDYAMPEVGDIRDGMIVSISSQGMIMDLGVKRDGIVPTADLDKLDEEERQAFKVGDEVPVYVLSTDEPDGLMVSVFRAKLNEDWIKAKQMMEQGDIVEAEIVGHNRGGVIVPFGRLRGFVPASHLTNIGRGLNDQQRLDRLTKMKGQEIPVKVIEVDRRRRRLVLSQREAQREWEEKRRHELLDRLQEGDVIKGRVSGIRDFGAFVDIGGADGLVHISELAWHRVDHPREVLRVGDEIEVEILKLDEKRQRISLSRKSVLANPWGQVEEKYYVGQLVEGAITRIVNYGAFVEIEPGIEGLLHVSQLSRGKVDDPREIIQEGETHLLRIVSIEPDRQRMGLSLKAVTPQEQIKWMAERDFEEEAVDEEVVASVEAATEEE